MVGYVKRLNTRECQRLHMLILTIRYKCVWINRTAKAEQ